MKSIQLKGQCNKPLAYNLCILDPSIRFGSWELWLKSVVVTLKSTCSEAVAISCNYIQDTQLVSSQVQVAPVPLCFFKLGGKKEEPLVQEFQECWFELSHVFEDIEFYIKNLTTDAIISEEHAVHIHILMRRKTTHGKN